MSILDAIIKTALGLVRGLFALIPSVEIPPMFGFSSSLGNALAAVDGVFPVGELGACILALVAMRAVIFLVEISIKVYELIPFKAS